VASDGVQLSSAERVALAERWRDTALAYEARARYLRELGESAWAEEYEDAALGWRDRADGLEAGLP